MKKSFDHKIIIDKFIEVDRSYMDFKYSSLEKIIINGFKKNNTSESRSNYIIESCIKSINRIYIMKTNKEIRDLKPWLSNVINNHNHVIMVSKEMDY